MVFFNYGVSCSSPEHAIYGHGVGRLKVACCVGGGGVTYVEYIKSGISNGSLTVCLERVFSSDIGSVRKQGYFVSWVR